jgi:hypothetical protein
MTVRQSQGGGNASESTSGSASQNPSGQNASKNASGIASGTVTGNGKTSANTGAHDIRGQTNERGDGNLETDLQQTPVKQSTANVTETGAPAPNYSLWYKQIGLNPNKDQWIGGTTAAPDQTTSGTSDTADYEDKKPPPTTPKNQPIPTVNPFTDPTPKQGKAILHIRGTDEIELDLTQRYATLAKDCVMRDIHYKGEDDKANIVEAKKGDLLCLKTFETYSGIVHASQGRLDKSPPRYYKLETKILVSIFKSQKNVVMRNIFIARASGQDIIEANPDIHPLTSERTQTIFHCLVTNMSPTEEDYEYLDGEPRGPGHDVNFMHYYNSCLKLKPPGVFKRWEYRFHLGLSDFNHKKNPGTVFQKLLGVGFDTKYKFVFNKDLHGKPEARMYYIEEFKKEHPIQIYGKADSELGKDYIARNLEDLECKGQDFESGYYRAFVLDDAFSRLSKFLEYDYNVAMEQNSKAYKDDRIRCLKTQSKAFYTCHPCVNVKKKGFKNVLQEPVLCPGTLMDHTKLLTYLHQVFLCDDKRCITADKLCDTGLPDWKDYVGAVGLKNKGDSMSCKDFVHKCAKFFSRVDDSNEPQPPGFSHGGQIHTGVTLHEPNVPELDMPEEANNTPQASNQNCVNARGVNRQQESSSRDEDSDSSSKMDDLTFSTSDSSDENPPPNESQSSDDNDSLASSLGEEDNIEIPYKEGSEISAFVRALIECHITKPELSEDEDQSASDSRYDPTPDEFSADLFKLNKDLKDAVKHALKARTGFEVDMHIIMNEVVSCLLGINNGDMERHRDALLRHMFLLIPCQDKTEPTRAVRINKQFERCVHPEMLLKMMDKHAKLISSHYPLPELAEIHLHAKEQIVLSDDIKKGVQTLLLPCFQKDNAVFNMASQDDVVVKPVEQPCCLCTDSSTCTRTCPCYKKKTHCTNCRTPICRNKLHLEPLVKHDKKKRSADKKLNNRHDKLREEITNGGLTPEEEQKIKSNIEEERKKHEEQMHKDFEKAKKESDQLSKETQGQQSTWSNNQRTIKKSSQFLTYGSFQMNLGDMIIVPGECLHYGLKRSNQVLLSATICPKKGEWSSVKTRLLTACSKHLSV